VPAGAGAVPSPLGSGILPSQLANGSHGIEERREGSGREWRTRGGEAASQSEFERTTPPALPLFRETHEHLSHVR